MTDRSRTYTWGDPMLTAFAATERSGLEILQAMVSGELPPPPIMATLGFDAEAEVEPGRVLFRLQPAEYHYNPIGGVHGGVHATLLDSVMGCAVHSRLPAGRAYTTLDISIRYLRAVTADSGMLRAEGTVQSLGRRVATASGTILDGRDRLVATGTTSCLLWDIPTS